MGRVNLISISISLNKPSLRFKEKLGAEEIDRGVYIRLFGKFEFIIGMAKLNLKSV